MIRTRYMQSLLALATPDDIRRGVDFYPTCHRRIAALADEYGAPFAAAVGAFAALSPNSSLEGNFRSLASCLAGAREGTPEPEITVASYNRGRRSAMRILSGFEDFSDVCSGPKITAFRHNLLYPGASERVTIDGHMIALLLGRPELDMRAANMEWRSWRGSDAKRYDHFERAFVRFARKIKRDEWPVCAYQATLWTMRRRLAGFAPVEIPAEVRPYAVRAA